MCPSASRWLSNIGAWNGVPVLKWSSLPSAGAVVTGGSGQSTAFVTLELTTRKRLHLPRGPAWDRRWTKTSFLDDDGRLRHPKRRRNRRQILAQLIHCTLKRSIAQWMEGKEVVWTGTPHWAWAPVYTDDEQDGPQDTRRPYRCDLYQ